MNQVFYRRKLHRKRGILLIKLFTHTDLDGIGCAILAKYVFQKEKLKIEYCNYDDIDTKVSEFLDSGEKVNMCIITDIRVSEEIAQRIENDFDDFYLLDHHPTALPLNRFKWCQVDIENADGIKTSGTEMFYEWLVKYCGVEREDVLDRFSSLVRDYDTWRWSILEENGLICKQVNELLYLYGRDEFETWCLSEIYDNSFPRLDEKDELLLRIKQKEIDTYIEKKSEQLFTSPMCGRVCGFVFADRFISELGNRLCKMHPEIDFVAMIDMASCVVSYRAVKEDIDLGKDVAVKFGGGGHPKAAGSEFSKEVMLKAIENIFC